MSLARLFFLRTPAVSMAMKRLAIALEMDIDAVARGAGDLADDHPLALGEAVDERALAGIAPADDGEFQRRLAGAVPRRRRRGSRFESA